MFKVVFVPSTGFLQFYEHDKKFRKAMKDAVFVPSTGFLQFYELKWMLELTDAGFRPLYGVSTILPDVKRMLKIQKILFSSPLRGFYNSTSTERSIQKELDDVFVPSTGFLQFYTLPAPASVFHTRFRPLYGVSTILPCPCYLA